MKVSFSYLKQQFANPEPILEKIGALVKTGALTLGHAVETFEQTFADFIGAKYAVGVGSGTDALFLSLKAAGVGPGDEVITAVNTFVATAGAIETAGARIRFVDCNERYVMDVAKLEAAITPQTKAVIPVHYTGQPVDMTALTALSEKHGFTIIEDSCTAIDGEIDGRRCGTIGLTGAFSLHPLKNLNVWGDGGLITTNSEAVRDQLHLLRNHGMNDRDTYAFYAYNSRLDSLQAVVGQELIKDVSWITEQRIEHARRYDAAFANIDAITVPERRRNERHVFHLYILLVEQRDALLAHLKKAGVSAKIHYPIPLHLQPASAKLGYAAGDFPVAEHQAAHMITLPAHQHLTDEELDYVIAQVRGFYGAS
ncbi:DegT/DnrJ/EryC1/StrS family aminotransferase [Acanthopleuribacter pedis]|uniref:DegT/DnrJ/EryC1/StrS family aminotransferase n=1 Tax=Acanthopleuribacter pedis TaxID=442870 RepID=A0A8J7QA87_9BACT|nr:DegT/DnrJ/EryC1/StrS family aminotransferase [Acanthopleuribacter pedis]MBO1317036.1 DegT/DnrJ/EryC1/StrS family aminotransferase [Acanthopleuribacter pedis]